jgi:hypothetical protein
MLKLRELVGGLIDRYRGPNKTVTYHGKTKESVERMRPRGFDESVEIGIISRQIVYHTLYTRWWVRDVKRVVFEVVGIAPPEVAEKMDPKLFITVTYPLLSNVLLKWTQYPHFYAINAYLDRLSRYVEM